MHFSELLSIKASSPAEWNDWQWQLGHCIRTTKDLEGMPGYTSSGEDEQAALRYPMQATPFYLSLARDFSPSNPILMQSLPHAMELDDQDALYDPLCEEANSPVPRLVHRYQDRALFLTTGTCAVRCRHCMRKRVWDQSILPPTDQELERCVDYLKRHTEVRELLISGGDPLVLPDQQVRRVLQAFAQVPNLQMLRIGSRTLTALPQRYTEELCKIFQDCGKTIWLASHFNHPDELSQEASQAVLRLMAHGVPVINQSVLLKGINDDADTLEKLFTGLLAIRIKPYYLFHGDPVHGTTCFRTGIQAGLDILAKLRCNCSGLALPAYAIDLPEGGGKVRLEPDISAGHAPDGTPRFYKLNGPPVDYR